MMAHFSVALLALLHVLIPVYWLGGDLGVFYSSRFLTDSQRTVPERLMALTILGNVDMAPRTALILALPTGATLASAKGWLDLPGLLLAPLWMFCLAWLAIAWRVHLQHGREVTPKRVDLAIRYGMLAVLAVTGTLGLAGRIVMPLFIALKLLILAVAISLGLLIRRQLVPLFPAVAALRREGSSPAQDRIIAQVIERTRPVVLLLWALVLAASLLGLATPA